MKVTLILDADDIPDNSEVTKVTGTKEYILKKNLTLYGPEGKIPIKMPQGFVYIVDEGDINMISAGTKLKIELEIEEAISLLKDLDSQ